jgi:hypothetical protein
MSTDRSCAGSQGGALFHQTPDVVGARDEQKGIPMQRIRLLAMTLVAALVLLGTTAMPAFSDGHTGTVDATVTVTAGPCIQVGVETINFGTQEFSTTEGTVQSDSSAYNLTNCGDADQSFYASGTDASNTAATATWTLNDAGAGLDCASSTNEYQMLLFGTAAFQRLSSSVEKVVPDTGANPVAPSGTHSVTNRLIMPCSGSDGAGETMSLSIIYTAATSAS